MIIVRLMGGLGNQMFQYALGRQLAFLNDTELKLDLSFLHDRPDRPSYTIRNYQLGSLKIKENFASKSEVEQCQRSVMKDKEGGCIFRRRKYYWIDEPTYAYNENILKLRGRIYLNGYWQSERYFSGITGQLKKEFSLRTNNHCPEMYGFIETCKKETVGIHVRKCDYLSNPAARSFLVDLPLSYYQEAIDTLRDHTDDPLLLVFSDDVTWVKDNFRLNVEYILVPQGDDPAIDMMMMSRCSHQIIANSSFSWWAAWLNQNPGKKVIAPNDWFINPELNFDDRYPEGWIRI